MSKSLGLLSASHQLLDVETMGDASPSCNFTGSLRTFVWIYHISFCFGFSFLNIKKLFGRIQELLKKIALFGRFLDQNGLQRQKLETQLLRGERERLFGSREREGKLKITFPFYGKGTEIRKLLREGKGREI